MDGQKGIYTGADYRTGCGMLQIRVLLEQVISRSPQSEGTESPFWSTDLFAHKGYNIHHKKTSRIGLLSCLVDPVSEAGDGEGASGGEGSQQ